MHRAAGWLVARPAAASARWYDTLAYRCAKAHQRPGGAVACLCNFADRAPPAGLADVMFTLQLDISAKAAPEAEGAQEQERGGDELHAASWVYWLQFPMNSDIHKRTSACSFL